MSAISKIQSWRNTSRPFHTFLAFCKIDFVYFNSSEDDLRCQVHRDHGETSRTVGAVKVALWLPIHAKAVNFK